MTDINHDARISALEENGGGGSNDNSKYLNKTKHIFHHKQVVQVKYLINTRHEYFFLVCK